MGPCPITPVRGPLPHDCSAAFVEEAIATRVQQPLHPAAGCHHAVAPLPPAAVILCEYSHSMGNSTGNIHKYFHAFESHPHCQVGRGGDQVSRAARMAGSLSLTLRACPPLDCYAPDSELLHRTQRQ